MAVGGEVLRRRGHLDAAQLGCGQLAVGVADGLGVGRAVKLAEIGRAALHAHHVGAAGETPELIAAGGVILLVGRVLHIDAPAEMGRNRAVIAVGHGDIGAVRLGIGHRRQVRQGDILLIGILRREIEAPLRAVRQLDRNAADRESLVFVLKRVKAQAGQLLVGLPIAEARHLEHIFLHVLAQPQIFVQRKLLLPAEARVAPAHVEQLGRIHAVRIARHHKAHALDVAGVQPLIHDLLG